MPTLQIEIAGSWRNVVDFDIDQLQPTLSGVNSTLAALRIDPAHADMRVLFSDGRVRTVEEVAGTDGWLPVTYSEPVPLYDVIVTAKMDMDADPMTFMAYRKRPGSDDFFITGSEEMVPGVYAWRHSMKAAPLSMIAEST